MSSLWWIIPFGAFMLWCVFQAFRGGGATSDKDESSTSGNDVVGLD